jgi:hypothetical protein
MVKDSFLNWYINPQMPEEAIKDFVTIGDLSTASGQGLEKQRHMLVELLNKNQLYVNLSEIDDAQFKLSEEDKALNVTFYWRASMSSLFTDTHPKMEALQIRLWRQATPTRKMNMLAQLNASARMLALAGLRSQFPQATESELRRRLASLILGEELAYKVYGDLPDAK